MAKEAPKAVPVVTHPVVHQPANNPATAPAAPVAKKEAKKEEPKGVELKEIASKIGITPRECRVILRKMAIRGEDKKRARWTFETNEVDAVVAKIKAAIEEKKKAAEAKKAEEAKAETPAGKK